MASAHSRIPVIFHESALRFLDLSCGPTFQEAVPVLRTLGQTVGENVQAVQRVAFALKKGIFWHSVPF
jgi:hypothetical protein